MWQICSKAQLVAPLTIQMTDICAVVFPNLGTNTFPIDEAVWLGLAWQLLADGALMTMVVEVGMPGVQVISLDETKLSWAPYLWKLIGQQLETLFTDKAVDYLDNGLLVFFSLFFFFKLVTHLKLYETIRLNQPEKTVL